MTNYEIVCVCMCGTHMCTITFDINNRSQCGNGLDWFRQIAKDIFVDRQILLIVSIRPIQLYWYCGILVMLLLHLDLFDSLHNFRQLNVSHYLSMKLF